MATAGRPRKPSRLPQRKRVSMPLQIPQVARTSPFLREIPESALLSATRLSVRRSFDAGTFLFQEQDLAAHAYILTVGRIRLFLTASDGSRVLLRLLSPGDFFGFRAAAMAPSRYGISAQAGTNSETLCWSRPSILRLLHSHHVLLFNLFSDFVERTREYQQRLLELATQPASRRIAQTLLRLSRRAGLKENGSVLLDGGLLGGDLAAMAGTTPETVSRVLARWKRAHIVQVSRQTIRILSLAEFRQFAIVPELCGFAKK